MKKKITLATGVASVVLAWSAFGQDPSAAPSAPTPPVAPSIAATVTPVATPTATASASASAKEDLEARIERKVKHGVSISVGPDQVERHIRRANHDGDDDMGGWI